MVMLLLFSVFTTFVFENAVWAASKSVQLAKVGDSVKPFRLKRLVQAKSESTYINVDDAMWAVPAGLAFSSSGPAIFSLEVSASAEVSQGVKSLCGPYNDTAAISAITPVRPAFRHKSFPSEADTALSPVS